jgi:uncharacterized protein with ATP-grasp and redox domains
MKISRECIHCLARQAVEIAFRMHQHAKKLTGKRSYERPPYKQGF